MDDLRAVLLKYAGYLLSARPYFSGKLKLKLQQKAQSLQNTSEQNFSEVINTILEDLAKAGYLQDHYLAEALANRELDKGNGPQKIYFKLISRGVDKTIAKDIISMLDHDAILASARKIKGRVSEPQKLRQKLYSKGFDTRTISSLIQNQFDDSM